MAASISGALICMDGARNRQQALFYRYSHLFISDFENPLSKHHNQQACNAQTFQTNLVLWNFDRYVSRISFIPIRVEYMSPSSSKCAPTVKKQMSGTSCCKNSITCFWPREAGKATWYDVAKVIWCAQPPCDVIIIDINVEAVCCIVESPINRMVRFPNRSQNNGPSHSSSSQESGRHVYHSFLLTVYGPCSLSQLQAKKRNIRGNKISGHNNLEYIIYLCCQHEH